MKRIPNNERARITAILSRVIGELADGVAHDDPALADVLSAVIHLCCKSQMQGDQTMARAEWLAAIELLDKDWLLTVRKLGDSFHLEARFGTEMKSATLQRSVSWIRKAGVN